MTRTLFGLAVSLLLAVLSGLMLVEAIAIKPPANVFPSVIIGVMGALALAAACTALLGLMRSGAAAADTMFVRESLPTVLVTAAALVCYVAAMTVSYLAASFAFLLALYLYLSGDYGLRSILARTVIAAAVSAALYVCFVLWLGVNLPA